MIITPLAKSQPETITLINKERQKYARQSSQGALPVVFVAKESNDEPFNPETDAALGFKYRRQSHHAEIEWWAGYNVKAMTELAKVLVMQAMLEGRKRVEVFNPYANSLSKYEWPGDKLNEALEAAGFQHEGHHEDWTKELEDVQIYGHVWMSDGYPTLAPDTKATLVTSGEWETDAKGKIKGWGVTFYREKNTDLYRQDRDLYRQKEGDDKTFAQHIEEAVDYVMTHEQVRLDPLWHGKERVREAEAEDVEVLDEVSGA